MTIKAGDFTIDAYEPYPAPIVLRYEHGGTIATMRFSHFDLADLQYAVNRAVRLAAAKLNDKEARAAMRIHWLCMKIEQEAMMAQHTGAHDVSLGSRPAKCPCCGSCEFRAHNAVRICLYCRSAT